MLQIYANLQVLIVEDNKFVRSVIKEVLQSIGVRPENIQEAADGTAGLQALLVVPTDLIICDWRMKPMDGLTFVRAVRDRETSRNPLIPIILCSAHTNRELVQLSIDSGVNEIMAKPISVQSLQSRIEAILTQPRPFVEASDYFGPDRRRRYETGVASAQERRRACKTQVKYVPEDCSAEKPSRAVERNRQI